MEPVMGRNIPKQCVPENSVCDFLSLGHSVPWMMCTFDDASLGRCVPWSTRPLDDASLNDVSRPFGTDWPYAEIGWAGLYRHGIARHTITLIYCVEILQVSRCCLGSGHTGRVRDVTSKGCIVQVKEHPRLFVRGHIVRIQNVLASWNLAKT